MSVPALQFDRAALLEICADFGIRRLAVFGSALRGDFGPASDIDVLVEFQPTARLGWAFVTLQDRLTEVFGRPVDLLTPDSIRPAYRAHILNTAQDVYVAA